MNARRDLLAEQPILAGDRSARHSIPTPISRLHPGAAAYYNGTEQSFMDKYGNCDLPDADGARRAGVDLRRRLALSRHPPLR